MAEYIKRDRLLRDPYFQKDRFPESHLLRMAIMNQPAADVVEVKHGRWVDRYGGKYVNPKYECSECRKEAPYRPKLDDLLNWYHEQDLSDFCPNCGAKMDGGENHESN